MAFINTHQKKGNHTLPDVGYFKLQVDTLNPKRIYVYHNNLIPSGIAQGYEVWEKVIGSYRFF